MAKKQQTVQEFLRANVRHLCITGSIIATVTRLMQEEEDPEVIPLMLQLLIAEDALRQLLMSAEVDQNEVDRVLEEVNRESEMIEALRAN